MLEWTKRKVAAVLALLATGITGGVVVTRDGSDRPAERRAERTTRPAPQGAPATTRAQEPAQAEQPGPERRRASSRQRRSPRRSASTGRRRPGSVRTLRPGDTLWEIAGSQLPPGASDARIARRVRYLAQLNRLEDPDLILAGERLRLRA